MNPWEAFVAKLPRGAKPARATPTRMVAFDMDGVLLDAGSSWVTVHRHFGVDNEASLEAFLRGEIDDHEFIRRDVALWTARRPGLTLADVDAILQENLVLMPGAKATVRRLHEEGIHCAIVSGGLDGAAHAVADRLGIDHVSANGLLADDLGRLTGEGRVGTPLADKATPLRRMAGQLGVPLGHVASVGDGSPDVSMFQTTGLGIAFRPSDPVVARWADVVVPGPSLEGVLPHVLPAGNVRP